MVEREFEGVEQAIVVFSAPDGEITLSLDRDRETIWASQAQIMDLFGLDRSGVSRHINNVFKDNEVDRDSCLQYLQTTPTGRPATLYNLDVILAVGYRAKSGRAIHFRRWANKVLKEYLIQGASINEGRLEQLGSIVRVLSRSSNELVAGVADVLASYVPGLRLLREYDDGAIVVPPGARPDWTLTYDEARAVIARLAEEFPQDRLLGVEPGSRLDAALATVYQGFGGQDLYPTVEEKAANLLYLIIKDHPLVDGNKRSAAALFVTFLARNGILADANGRPRVSNNALAAITLMVAMSDPAEKELMVSLVVKMLAEY